MHKSVNLPPPAPPLPPPDPAFLHMPGSRDPLPMEKLGSTNKIRSSELECDLLGKMNNFIFPSIFFFILSNCCLSQQAHRKY